MRTYPILVKTCPLLSEDIVKWHGSVKHKQMMAVSSAHVQEQSFYQTVLNCSDFFFVFYADEIAIWNLQEEKIQLQTA